jgi:hypothetical protein
MQQEYIGVRYTRATTSTKFHYYPYTLEMEQGLFGAERISPSLPYTYSVGGGYPDQYARSNTVVDVLGLGSVSQKEFAELRESTRSGMAFGQLGGFKKSRKTKKQRRRSNKRRHIAYRKHSRSRF